MKKSTKILAVCFSVAALAAAAFLRLREHNGKERKIIVEQKPGEQTVFLPHRMAESAINAAKPGLLLFGKSFLDR